MTACRALLTRWLSGTAGLLLVAGVLALLAPGAARADSAPPSPSPATPTTVTADGLPTVQVNGVVWAQAVGGNTVYPGGSFTPARPARPGPGTQETRRNHPLPFHNRPGDPITSFLPDLHRPGLA